MKKKALLIGINYQKQDYALSGCINDAKNIYFLLRSKFGFEQSCVAGLLETEATRKSILAGMRWLVKGAQPGDLLFLSFSGHGSQRRDFGDSDHAKDETIVPYDWTMNGEIANHEIYQIFSSLPKGVNVIAVFDSCYSGTILNLRYTVKDVYHDRNGFSFAETMDHHSGDIAASILCFCGCLDSQTSVDALEDNIFRGAAVWSLYKILDSHPKPETIKISELFYAMKVLMKKYDSQQTIALSSSFQISDDCVFTL